MPWIAPRFTICVLIYRSGLNHDIYSRALKSVKTAWCGLFFGPRMHIPADIAAATRPIAISAPFLEMRQNATALDNRFDSSGH
jgi:hypothetical protein